MSDRIENVIATIISFIVAIVVAIIGAFVITATLAYEGVKWMVSNPVVSVIAIGVCIVVSALFSKRTPSTDSQYAAVEPCINEL